ncbi:MAG: retroviral-like aspartic protease family protein [Treponema sp.]|nr:retroviral-like aspartic protease family protein [Treponema sp.]
MGTVHAEITLKNPIDIADYKRGFIKEHDVRSVTVTAVVDTGAMTLVINEELRQKLGLIIKEEKPVLIANGQRIKCKVTEAVDIHWKNRGSSQRAVIIPGAEKVLLGAIPLEDMDLIVNPVTQELVGAHGDIAETLAL